MTPPTPARTTAQLAALAADQLDSYARDFPEALLCSAPQIISGPDRLTLQFRRSSDITVLTVHEDGRPAPAVSLSVRALPDTLPVGEAFGTFARLLRAQH